MWEGSLTVVLSEKVLSGMEGATRACGARGAV